MLPSALRVIKVDEKLVQRLLRKADFADFPSLGPNKDLCKAFAGGHEGAMEILLAGVTSGSNEALRAACAEGDQRISKMLLRGA